MAKHKKVICYVDDSRNELERFCKYMGEHFEIVAGVSLEDVVQKLGDRRPALFLLDLYYGPDTKEPQLTEILQADREAIRAEARVRALMAHYKLGPDRGFAMAEFVAKNYKCIPRAFFSRNAFLKDALRAFQLHVPLLEKPDPIPESTDDYDAAFQANVEEVAQSIKELIPQSSVLVFVSHSTKDEEKAAELIALMEAGLEMPPASILATSVEGYELRPGRDAPEMLRRHLQECAVVVGLLTKESLASESVLMELGAAWALDKTVILLLGNDVSIDAIPWPLRHLESLHLNNQRDRDRFLDAIATECILKRRCGS